MESQRAAQARSHRPTHSSRFGRILCLVAEDGFALRRCDIAETHIFRDQNAFSILRED
jgi:hypothetical protein